MRDPVVPSHRASRILSASDPQGRDAWAAPTRRHFLSLVTAAAAAVLMPLAPRRARAQRVLDLLLRNGHPEPRPGIDASRVLTAEQLADTPDVISLFDSIREIPHIVDGIRCYCGCAEIDGYRSLLTCFEAPGMSQYCEECQGQGQLAYARWKEGQTLEQIRRATDARYGSGSGAGRSMRPMSHEHDHL